MNKILKKKKALDNFVNDAFNPKVLQIQHLIFLSCEWSVEVRTTLFNIINCDSLSSTTAVKIWIISYTSHHFTPHRRYELNKLTSLPMCGFITQLVEHRTGIAEVTGSNPVEAPVFFRLLLSKFTAMISLHFDGTFACARERGEAMKTKFIVLRDSEVYWIGFNTTMHGTALLPISQWLWNI